jgi:hypothetical protein
VAAAPADAVLVVFHTNTIGYLSSDERDRLASELSDIGSRRRTCRLSGEGASPGEGFEGTLELTDVTHNEGRRVLAKLVQHGRAFAWEAD